MGQVTPPLPECPHCDTRGMVEALLPKYLCNGCSKTFAVMTVTAPEPEPETQVDTGGVPMFDP